MFRMQTEERLEFSLFFFVPELADGLFVGLGFWGINLVFSIIVSYTNDVHTSRKRLRELAGEWEVLLRRGARGDREEDGGVEDGMGHGRSPAVFQGRIKSIHCNIKYMRFGKTSVVFLPAGRR